MGVTRTRYVEPDIGRDGYWQLRRVLVGDAVFCAISGLIMIGSTQRLSEFTGLGPSWVPGVIGAGVLLWALELGLIARKEKLRRVLIWFVIGGGLAWILASYATLLSGILDLTTVGMWTVGLLAEVVAAFAALQYLGLRRMHSL